MVLFVGGAPPQSPDDEVALGWLDLAGRDPLDALLGFVAPDDWWALGLSSSGRASPLDRADLDGGDPVRLVVFVGRDGRSVTILRRGTATEELDEPPSGLLGDCLHRALGLPTPPPPARSGAFWAVRWLDRVVTSLLAAPSRGSRRCALRSWPAVAALHPALPAKSAASVGSSAGDTAPDAGAPDPADLAAATGELAAAWPWARLRTEGAPPPGVEPGRLSSPLAPEVAIWMDDGMFARWYTGALPDLLDTCHQLLTPEAWAGVAATVTDTAALDRPGDGGGR